MRTITGKVTISRQLEGAAGKDGKDARVRAPLRVTSWDGSPAGLKLYTGEGDDDPFTDIVWRQEGGAVRYWQCVQDYVMTAVRMSPGVLMKGGKAIFLEAAGYSFVATEILWASVGRIGEFLFEQGLMKSQGQSLEGIPNVTIDGNRGMGWFTGSIVNPFRRIDSSNLGEMLVDNPDSSGDAMLDLGRTGLKVMIDFSAADLQGVLTSLGYSYFRPPYIPAELRYAGAELEIYNATGETMALFTGNFINGSWEDFNGMTADFTSPAIVGYTYYRFRCMAFRKSAYSGSSIGSMPGDAHGYVVAWIMVESKGMR